ncbi:DNA polymerase IV [candidate division KSB1 bacterium]|nr:DNA polymerase IV [candidate division KSB1 bacterium]
MSRKIIHIDMDAFYASVEQLDHPEYRGKPVIVGSDPKKGSGRGVVAAASYEARKYGIHSALPISKAYRLCPDGVFVRGRGKRYVEISSSIMEIFYKYTPKVEPISLDEAFLDLTGTERLWGDVENTARKIKDQIQRDLHLTASVGIGPNKLIAKIASDLDKPDGFVSVPESNIQEFLENLSVKKLWGVGPQTQKQLIMLGVESIGDLARLNKDVLIDRFGKMGEILCHHAKGLDENLVHEERSVKSISNEVTFNRDEDSQEIIRNTLLSLSEKVGFRLREKNLRGRTIQLKIRFEGFDTHTRSQTLEDSTCLDHDIYETVLLMLQSLDLNSRKVRLVGVGISQFMDSENCQVSLFEGESDKTTRAQQAMDLIKQRFGKRMIKRGGTISSQSESNTKKYSPHSF